LVPIYICLYHNYLDSQKHHPASCYKGDFLSSPLAVGQKKALVLSLFQFSLKFADLRLRVQPVLIFRPRLGAHIGYVLVLLMDVILS